MGGNAVMETVSAAQKMDLYFSVDHEQVKPESNELHRRPHCLNVRLSIQSMDRMMHEDE